MESLYHQLIALARAAGVAAEDEEPTKEQLEALLAMLRDAITRDGT